MMNFLKSFRADDDGAVTVDWVVLTAAIVGLSVAVIYTIGASTTDNAKGVGAHIQSLEMPDYNS